MSNDHEKYRYFFCERLITAHVVKIKNTMTFLTSAHVSYRDAITVGHTCCVPETLYVESARQLSGPVGLALSSRVFVVYGMAYL